jgi:hypothetical protein
VEAITYRSPFFGTEKSEQAAKALGIKQHIIDFTETILEQVQHPPHGLGKAMNPCIDCHAKMFERAGQEMEKQGFDFIVSGEVLAQRPMSQNKQSLGVVAKCSTYGDLLVRPLSAALLPPTLPIREGWIDVSKLPAFSGRSRTPQIELAKHFKLKSYPAPAGGCLLTEQQFGYKLKDLLEHEGLDDDRTNVWLLPVGRHLRLTDEVKIIVGSDQRENQILQENARPEIIRLYCPTLPGPTVLAPPNINEEQLHLAARICARYAKTPSNDQPVPVEILQNQQTRILHVLPLPPAEVEPFRIQK